MRSCCRCRLAGKPVRALVRLSTNAIARTGPDIAVTVTAKAVRATDVDPIEAVKYQLLIMFLIAGGTGLGAVSAVIGGVYRLTDARHRLRLDRLGPPKHEV